MTVAEPYEATIPCENCQHPLGEHLSGTSKADPCEWCWCANFTTTDDCPDCLGLRTIEGHDGVERRCATCGGSGNA